MRRGRRRRKVQQLLNGTPYGTYHRESRVYLCEICLQTFSVGSELRKHKNMHSLCDTDTNTNMKNTEPVHFLSKGLVQIEQLESFGILRDMLQNGLKSKLTYLIDSKLGVNIKTTQTCDNNVIGKVTINNEESFNLVKNGRVKNRVNDKDINCVKNGRAKNRVNDKDINCVKNGRVKNQVDNKDINLLKNGRVRKTKTSSNSSTKNNYRFTCNECGKKCPSKAVLRIHLNSHFGIKPFKCQTCGIRVSQKSGLATHMRIHTGEKPYSCTVCNRAFTQPVSREHMCIHTGEKLYKCNLCPSAFGSMTVLTTHKTSKHSLLRPFQCDICLKTFTDKGYMVKHRTIHRVVRPYPCDKCAKSFITNSNLRRHQDIHMGHEPYGCSICDKSYNNKGSLTYHMSTHIGYRQYVCGICDQELTTKQNLQFHLKRHAQLNAFKH